MRIDEFLLARIAEDEAVARATRAADDSLTWGAADYDGTGACGMGGPVDGPSGYASIVIDPARVLAECEAKRRIVAEHQIETSADDPICRHLADEPCPTLRALASIWAEHPDYDPAWRPDAKTADTTRGS